MDLLDDVQQPRCPECGTVLHTQGTGFVCRPCGLTVIGSIQGDQRGWLWSDSIG